MGKNSNNFLTKLDLLKNRANVGQLLYIAEQVLDTAALIGWENDGDRREYNLLSDKIKRIRVKRKELRYQLKNNFKHYKKKLTG